MAAKGNYEKGKGPPPISAAIKAKIPDGPKRDPSKKREPVPFSEEIFEAMLGHICEGCTPRTIADIEGFPEEKTIYRWMRAKPELRERFDEACRIRCTAFGEMAVDAARDGSQDWRERLGYNGGTPKVEVNGEAIARSTLIVNTYLRVAAQYAPQRWSQNQKIELSATVDVMDRLSAGRARVAAAKLGNPNS